MTREEQIRALSALLDAAGRGRDNPDRAARVVERFGSLRRALTAHPAALTACGLSESEALLMTALPALRRRIALEAFGPSPALGGDAALRDYARALYTGASREKLTLIVTDEDGALRAAHTVAEGSDAALTFEMRQLVALAVRADGPVAVICHNHPGGGAAFSEADRRVTRDAAACLKAVGVRLRDHLLIAGDEVISLRQREPGVL